MSSSTSSSSSILTSLRYYDEIRAKSTNVIRPEGSSVDLLTHETEEISLCHISSILAFTFGDYIPWLTAFEDAATIAMAIQHLNTGDGSIVPELDGLPDRCPVRFTVEFADTEFQGGVTLRHVVQQVNRDPPPSDFTEFVTEAAASGPGGTLEEGTTTERIPCAFLGAYRSAVSIPMSIVTGVFGVPQISGASTSADLDDSSQYPLFGRTIPSDAGNAIPFVQYLYNTLNIKHLALINVNDAYGNAFAEGLRKAAEDYAPDMIIVQIPMDDDESSISAAVTKVKNTEYRFIFCLVFSNPTHDALLTEAYQQGIAGTGVHNWIFGDSFLGTLDGRTFEKDSDLQYAYRGVGLLEVTGGVPGGVPKYDTFRSKLSELHNPEDLEYLGSLWPKHDHPDYSATGEPPFINDDTYLSNAASGFAPFFYEAVIALGLAACSASEEEVAITGQNHFDHFVTTEFTSFSGKVVFDPTTGTRLPNSALYKVTNYIDDEIENDNGEIVIKFQPVITNLFRNSEWTVLNNYTFNDGTTNLPSDLPPPIIIKEDEYNLPFLIGAPLGAVLLLVVVIFLFYEHKRKQNDSVWHVKKEELKFPDPPHIIGQGSFGVVLLAEYRGTQVAVKHVIPPSTKLGSGGNVTATSTTAAMPNAGMRSGSAVQWGGTNTVGGSGSNSGIGTSSGMSLGMSSAMGTKSNMMSSGMISGTMSMFQTGGGKQSETALRKRLKQEFIEEMRYLSKLRHPCVTTVMGAVIDRGEEPMLIMEYMDHGSLYDLLHNETMVIEGELLLPVLRDISQGVRFLHSAVPQVLHGDLKAQNILVDNRFRAKVADFGLSQKQNLGGTGTPFWMAPELLRGESCNTAATDIYSFGIILYEVYSRKDPYEGEEPMEVLKLVADQSVKKRPPAPRHMPTQLESLMAECLQDDPEQRPTFEEVDIRVKRIDAETATPASGGKSANISLFDIFPRHIAEALQAGRTVEPEHRECVTIFFSDIVGFTDISSTLDPRKVSNMLDRLYTKFDALSEEHDIFKVETIGDAYMAVSNLVKDQPDDHCKRIAQFAIDAVREANGIQIDTDDPTKGFVNIRVGFHSGSVVADVVGTRNPRYCLFGDTVNTSSRMESNSKVNRIHCSQAAALLLRKQAPEIPCRSRGVIPIKGKGKMKTYWVNDSTEPPSTIKTINMLGEVESKEQPMQSVRDRSSFMMEPLAESGDEKSSAFFTPSTRSGFIVSTSSLPPE